MTTRSTILLGVTLAIVLGGTADGRAQALKQVLAFSGVEAPPKK